MTRTGYIFGKLLSTFGVAPLEKYRTEAAFESHLLMEAEAVVGLLAWSNLEEVTDISTEYWNLRKISKKEGELEQEIDRLSELLETAQDSRVQALEDVADATKDDVLERDKTSEKIDRLLQERDDIQKDGRTIKRTYSGLKIKLEVLLEEHDGKGNLEAEKTQKELDYNRTKFNEIKERRDAIDKRIEELQQTLQNLSQNIEKENKAIRSRADQQFGTIGKTNKELGNLQNKMGLLSSEKNELCAKVGHFVINNSKDPDIQKAAREHQSILSLIQEVRASSNRLRKILNI